MACLEPCNTASCTTTPLPCLPIYRRNPPAVPHGAVSERSHWCLSLWEIRCCSAPRLRAGAHPPFPYLWDCSSDCPLLHRGRPSKAPRDRKRIRRTQEGNSTRGILPGWRTGVTRTARPVATSLPPPDLSRIPYLGVKISPG